MYEYCTAEIQNYLLKAFKLIQGLKNGDTVAPHLFNVVLENAIRKMNVDRPGVLYKRSIHNVDIILAQTLHLYFSVMTKSVSEI